MKSQLRWTERAEYLDSEGLSLSPALPLLGSMSLRKSHGLCYFSFYFLVYKWAIIVKYNLIGLLLYQI